MEEPNRVTLTEELFLGPGGPRTFAVDIERPTPEMLAHDPTVIQGFAQLARRVICQAFEEAANGTKDARLFLTSPDEDGLLEHWIKQAGLAVPLAEFCRKAESFLNDPVRQQSVLDSRLMPRQQDEEA